MRGFVRYKDKRVLLKAAPGAISGRFFPGFPYETRVLQFSLALFFGWPARPRKNQRKNIYIGFLLLLGYSVISTAYYRADKPFLPIFPSQSCARCRDVMCFLSSV